MLRWIHRWCFTSVLEAGARPGRVASMEGVRGLAILMVFAAHCGGCLHLWTEPHIERALGLIGAGGVDLFFVLSGYLIYGIAMEHRKPWRSYLARRAQRIYPPFFAALALYLTLALTLPAGAGRLPAEGAAVYLLQCALLLPGMFDIPPLFTVAWTLSYEAFFYAAVPLFVAAAGLPRRTARARAALILLLTAAYTLAIALRFPERWSAAAFSPWIHWRLLLFPAGMLAWEAVRAGWRFPPRWHWISGAALLLAAGPLPLWLDNPAFQQPYPPLARALLLGAAIAAAAAAAFSGPGPLTRALCWTPLRWLGNLSYSFYLVHTVGLNAVAIAARPWTGAPFWLLCLAGFAAATVVSLVLFHAVERPFSLTPRRPPSTSPALVPR